MTGVAMSVFKDRRDAGRQLAVPLQRYASERPVVVALPRGGVPVGYEVARALGAPLDIMVVRKLGAPGQPELGIGAVVDGDHPERVLNDDVVRLLDVSAEYLRGEIECQLAEIHRRQQAYRGGRPPVGVAGRTAIVVDDGLATGASMRAALRGLRRAGPRRLVLAVPVAPTETLATLAAEADDVVCLSTPSPFGAVGYFYDDFEQTDDVEVVALLESARATVPDALPTA
ncbi:MAG: phosphoribosyltransferase [Deltaproteobacteria bacterium]|nr:phosphoribosyltransferase [Deltaproteobacteria bacterium]